MGIKINVAERLKKYSKRDDSGCLLWTGCVNRQGGGSICMDGRAQRVHRVAYILAYGSLPKNSYVLQRCNNSLCVNPDHLYLKSRSETVKESIQKGRRHPDRNAMRQYYEGCRLLRKVKWDTSEEEIIFVVAKVWEILIGDFRTDIMGERWGRSKSKKVISGLKFCRKAIQRKQRKQFKKTSEEIIQKGEK